jgi:polysaccharide deacetylase family sporulation protein PdaB
MRVVVLNRRQVTMSLLGIILILCTLFTAIIIAPKAIEAASTKRIIPIYCVDKKEKIISISFDAAWGNEDTNTLIQILAKYKVKATFFVVGEWVDKYPESVKALSDAGHEVMNHSNTHPHMPKLSNEDMLNEIKSCDEKIARITGVTPILFRPPFGDYNNELITNLKSINHYCIQWDVDSLDWKNPTPEQIQQTVLKKVKPGSIVLFHNAAINTPAALPGIIEHLQKDGYTLVPISKLIYKDNYTIDTKGMQHPVISSAS